MRVGSFRVKGNSGKLADVSIVPLPGLAGSDLANVNRWRGMVGQPEVAEADLPKLAEKVQVGEQEADLFDLGGKNPDSGEKARILAAVLRRDGVAWFFKMTGPDELVTQQKPVFKEFLKTVVFSAGGAGGGSGGQSATLSSPTRPLSTNAKRAPVENTPKPAVDVPSGWQEVPAGQMLVAKYTIGGANGAKADVNVSNLPGTGGGLIANVNRWRTQLGLPATSEADLQKESETVEVAGGKAILVTMQGRDSRSGQPARLVGAIVPQGDQTWFYKLLGDAGVVEREKAAFTKFVQTAKYSNVP